MPTPPAPISSYWNSSDSCSTSYASPQDVSAWIDAHIARASFRMGETGLTTSDPITTSWISGGVKKEVSTTRLSGESDADWIARHFSAVRALMVSFPPDT